MSHKVTRKFNPALSKYVYRPCAECGQYVAHSKRHDAPLHAHRWSEKCRKNAAKRKQAK